MLEASCPQLLKTIGDHEVSDDRTVVDRLAIPLTGDRFRIDRKRLVLRADPWPSEIRHQGTRRHRGDQPTVRITEARPVIGPKLDRIPVFVDIAMV